MATKPNTQSAVTFTPEALRAVIAQAIAMATETALWSL
jgi:hypothetical protein